MNIREFVYDGDSERDTDASGKDQDEKKMWMSCSDHERLRTTRGKKNNREGIHNK